MGERRWETISTQQADRGMMGRTIWPVLGFLSMLMAAEWLARTRGWGLPAALPPEALRGVVVDAATDAPTLVVLGDSVPWGFGLENPRLAWPVLVGRRLAARGTPWRVVDVSLPGETSLQGWARWQRDVLAWHPRRLIIAFGLNDGHLRRTAADCRRWQRFPRGWGRRIRLLHLARVLAIRPSRSRQEPALAPRLEVGQTVLVLRHLVMAARRQGITPYLLTPTPVGRNFHPEWPEAIRAYQQDVYARLAAAIRDLGRAMDVPVIDVYAQMSPPRDEWLLPDGVHLSGEGQKQVAENVIRASEW